MKLNTEVINNSFDSRLQMNDSSTNGHLNNKSKGKLKRKKSEPSVEVVNDTSNGHETPNKKRKVATDQSGITFNSDTLIVQNENVSLATSKKEVDYNPSNLGKSVNQQALICKTSGAKGKWSNEPEGSKSTLSTKEVNEITANYLRSSFKTASGLTILRKFVTVCIENTERDLASEYLEKSGNVLEILRLLDGCDNKNLDNAALVFSGMHIVIMKILEKYPQNIPAAQEACHHLIRAHVSIIHAMMSNQSNPRQRKIVLRLLASIVSLGDSLPRELLAHLSFHQETLALMSQQTKPSDPQSVRACFIHFILSFLVDSRVAVIRALLDKQGLLSSIFPELIYDSHATVHLVLNTIKTYVLENSAINKTLKLHLFSTPAVRNLVCLYNWKGPRNWPGFGNEKRRNFTESVNCDEKAIVVEVVHDFLLLLLTSNRYGIIFNDKTLGTTGRKHNQLVNTILQSLECPWEHKEPCDLVCKILAACPDLMKPQLTYTEPFLEPRLSKKWIAVMGFVKRILEAVAPENFLKASLPELTSLQLVNATLTLTMPSIVLKKAVLSSLTAPSVILRHEAVTTLTIMLKQVKKFLEVAEGNMSASAHSNLRFHVRDYITKNIPSVGDILKVWRRADKLSENIEEITLDKVQSKLQKFVHFSSILDLIQSYYQVLPEWIDFTDLGELGEDSRTLLTSLSYLEDVDELDLNNMKIKAIQIIQVLNPRVFAPEDKFLRKTLLFLIPLLGNSSAELKSKGMETIKILLKDSKIFENCEDQIDIWLNSFNLLENDQERTEVAQWLVKIIPKAVRHVEKYQGLIGKFEKNDEKYNVVENHPNEPANMGDNTTQLMQPTTSIPSILCAAFESLEKKSNETAGRFITFITILTLHCQVSPNVLIRLSEDIQHVRVEYLNSWKGGKNPKSLNKILPNNIIGKFSKILLAEEENTFDEILKGGHILNSSYEILNLLKMAVFYLTQFIKSEKLTQEQFDLYKRVIIALLDSYNYSEGAYDSTCVLECSRHILTHPILLDSFTPIPKVKNTTGTIVTTGLLEILEKIIEVNEKSDLPELFLPFKNKLLSHLRIVLKKSVGGWTLRKTQYLAQFIEILQLKSTDIQELLKILTKLPKGSFLTKDRKTLSIWGEVTPKLIELLSEIKNSELPTETQVIHKLCISFTHLRCTGIDVGNWEKALHKFLKTFPHHIEAVDPQTFNSLLENQFAGSTIELISFLIERNSKFIPLFTEYISTKKSAIRHHELIFPVLASNLSYKWNPELLSKICEEYEQDIINYFLFSGETKDWINENVSFLTYLIDSCFTLEACERISVKILSSGDKLETVDLNYTKLLHSLYMRLSKLHQNPQEILSQALQIFTRLITSTLKKNAKDDDWIEILCKYISQIIKKLRSTNRNFIFEDLSKSYSWPQFTRFSLRSGLKNSQNNSKRIVPLIKTLSEVCDIAYEDQSENEYVRTLFEMTTSHSEFVNLILSSQNIKRDLLRLIYVLIKKNPLVMTSSHIPLYLSAYNATLSESDQQILLILHYYESSGINLKEYKPYLFGEAAASHYSVRERADTAIWRQPPISQVLQLFNIDTVENTIRNFPVQRTLKLNELHPSESVYDPAFYLPLLTHLLADNNVVACHNVTQSGALALVFAACGSTCREIRMTAFTVIRRFYYHLEATRSKEKLLWMRMIDAIRNGIILLERPLADVRLNCFVSTFLAKSSLVATQPLNPLYAPLQNFFMAKQELDLKNVPEFSVLFNSSDINHKVHRHWILEVVRDGLKTDIDMEIFSKCFLLRTIFYFYGSVLADPGTKILILQVINAVTNISKAGLFLCRNSGLLVWLDEVAREVSFRNIEGIELIINIVRTLLDTIFNCNDKDNHIQFMLLQVLKTMIPKLSRNTTMSCYTKFLSSLEDILQSKLLCRMIHKNEIQSLIEVSKNIVGDLEDCEDILMHKCEFITKERASECKDGIISAKCNLRNIVITWRSQIKS